MSRSSYRLPLLLLVLAALVVVFVSVRRAGRPTPAGRTVMGEGPAIVIVPGLGSGAAHWLPVAQRLARDHRVVIVDLPGQGATPLPEPFSLERAALALEAVLAEESGPVTLVGHSVGGLVAAQAALDRPGRVRTLVLVETALRPQLEGAERDAFLRALRSDLPGVVRDAYVSFGRDSAQGRRLAAEAAALEPATLAPWIQLALTIDVSERLSHLRKPLLAVLSDRSWPADEAWGPTARALGYDRVPGVEPVRLTGTGHFVMLDEPERLAALIARFSARPGEQPVAAR